MDFMEAMKTNVDKIEFETPEQKSWIVEFMNSTPEVITTIIQEIGKIEGMRYKIEMIPSIVLIVGKLIHQRAILMKLENQDNLILLIELILDTMIEIEFIYLPLFEKQSIEKCINGSVELLKYTILKGSYEEEIPCLRFWFRDFWFGNKDPKPKNE